MKNFIKITLSLFLTVALVACTSTTEESGIKDGTYTGVGTGYMGEVQLDVTVTDSMISDIVVVSSEETESYSQPVFDNLIPMIIEHQSVNVDVISGSTGASTAVIEGVKAALKDAGATEDQFMGEVVVEVGEDLVIDADVVVVGAGGAGLSAAIEAQNAGAKVVILEATGISGGNTTRATGGLNAAKTTVQDTNEFGQEAGVLAQISTARETYPELDDLTDVVEQQYNEYLENPVGYFDSVELFKLDTLVGGGNLNDHDLVDTLVGNSSDAVDWLVSHGAQMDLVGSFGGASVMRIHKPVNDQGQSVAVGSYIVPVLTEVVSNAGVEIIFNTRATEILMEDGKAVGVVGNNGEQKVTVNASAVIIATGGFGANAELVVEYAPQLDGFVTTNADMTQGDGISMVEAVGGALVDMEYIQIHPTVEQETSALITEGLRGDGAILVNQAGSRFVDEVGTRDEVSAEIIAQEGSYAYLIIDQKMVDASAVIAGYITKGLTVEGETVAELAENIGVDPEVLVSNVDTWNGFVADNYDPVFGRTSFAEPLDTGSYYAIKIAPGVHHTMGGVNINTHAEVLDVDGNVIDGLYAAGEVTGGIHGNNRLGGNAVADVIIFGRIAGQSAGASLSE